MRELPILFSAPMVCAILAGRKTQTRRVVRFPHILTGGETLHSEDIDCAYFGNNPDPGFYAWLHEYPEEGAADLECPYGRLGWRPSIHMPRWASRITLEVTGVHIERLQSITGMDAIREGISPPAHIPQDGADLDWAKRSFASLWQSLNAKRPGCSWDDNPWVWVVEFDTPLLKGTRS